jgi:hypothetical protein
MRRDESGTLAATTVVTKTIKLCTAAGRRTITFNYRKQALTCLKLPWLCN